MLEEVLGLLTLAQQKIIPIIAFFLTTGLIVFQPQPIAKWLFIEKIPDSMAWIFLIIFIFSGFLLILNFLSLCITSSRIILGWKVPYVSRQGGKIIKLFSKSGLEVLSKDEIIKDSGLSVHRFDYLAEKLIDIGYLETDGDAFNYDGPKYWLTQKGRLFLKRRLLW